MNAIQLQTLWKRGNDPASFSGTSIFKRRTRAKDGLLKKEVFPYLNTYTKFRVAKRPRVYNPYFVRKIRKVIQSDLIFMDQPRFMVEQNEGYRYVLIVQDIFSRKIWARPVKNKQGRTVSTALREILTNMAPFSENARLVIDRGTEYLNREVRALLQSFGLDITHPSDGHASHVERANLSLQRLLFQNMYERGGPRRWLDFLPEAVNIMNNRYHRIIRMSPNEAEDPVNLNQLFEAMSLKQTDAVYKEMLPNSKKKPSKFKLGDVVRIQKEKRIFNRGYQPTFTDEVFKVSQILDHLPITMYKLTEWDEVTEIQGNFYPEELTLVRGDIFKIDHIVKRGRRNGVPSALVRWEGFSRKYDSWIPLTNLQHGSL
jgi:hypothetical protein